MVSFSLPWYPFTNADLPLSALASDPEAAKVRDWRHKLQKAFLSKTVPTVSVVLVFFSFLICLVFYVLRLLIFTFVFPISGVVHALRCFPSFSISAFIYISPPFSTFPLPARFCVSSFPHHPALF